MHLYTTVSSAACLHMHQYVYDMFHGMELLVSYSGIVLKSELKLYFQGQS